jgi:hypothetical protein
MSDVTQQNWQDLLEQQHEFLPNAFHLTVAIPDFMTEDRVQLHSRWRRFILRFF